MSTLLLSLVSINSIIPELKRNCHRALERASRLSVNGHNFYERHVQRRRRLHIQSYAHMLPSVTVRRYGTYSIGCSLETVIIRPVLAEAPQWLITATKSGGYIFPG